MKNPSWAIDLAAATALTFVALAFTVKQSHVDDNSTHSTGVSVSSDLATNNGFHTISSVASLGLIGIDTNEVVGVSRTLTSGSSSNSESGNWFAINPPKASLGMRGSSSDTVNARKSMGRQPVRRRTLQVQLALGDPRTTKRVPRGSRQ